MKILPVTEPRGECCMCQLTFAVDTGDPQLFVANNGSKFALCSDCSVTLISILSNEGVELEQRENKPKGGDKMPDRDSKGRFIKKDGDIKKDGEETSPRPRESLWNIAGWVIPEVEIHNSPAQPDRPRDNKGHFIKKTVA